MVVRTRFAPSPTGFLHIGSARTALYAWLYAKKMNGQFILRIEDTDSERSTQEFVTAILEGMDWLGLDYDEGPFYQTKHMTRYQAVIDQLLADGHAYVCTCSPERLEQVRRESSETSGKPRYDGHCRDLNISPDIDEPHVIRFKNPQEGAVTFHDLVFGDITVQNKELDDLIIRRSDGMPTYNLTVVVDDMDMGISHVIRGDDHVNNTPRQINILRALGAPLPQYAHLPMLLGEDGKRLSKRKNAVSVQEYRDQGILPHALLNYLIRLGFSHGDKEIFSREEMIDCFSLEGVNKSAAQLNTEKLLWLNHHYLKDLPKEAVLPELVAQAERDGLPVANGPDLESLLAVQAERCQTLAEIIDKSRFFYEDVTSYDDKAVKKAFKPETAEILTFIKEQFASLSAWDKTSIHSAIEKTCAHFAIKLGKVGPALRVALTGSTASPGIDDTVYMVGQARAVKRLTKAVAFCEANI